MNMRSASKHHLYADLSLIQIDTKVCLVGIKNWLVISFERKKTTNFVILKCDLSGMVSGNQMVIHMTAQNSTSMSMRKRWRLETRDISPKNVIPIWWFAQTWWLDLSTRHRFDRSEITLLQRIREVLLPSSFYFSSFVNSISNISRLWLSLSLMFKIKTNSCCLILNTFLRIMFVIARHVEITSILSTR